MATCIPGITITEAVLTSSTAAEPGVGEAAWAAGTTYGVGDKVIIGAPTSTVTVSVASPGVVSWSGHGLANDTPVVLSSTGDLPTGLSEGVIYYVVNRAADTFQLSAVPGGAPIVTTGTQSGTHTATAQVHRIYESLAASNTGNPPAIDDGTKWLDVGPTNRWAMLDLYRSSKTWAPSPLTVVLTPGQRIDSLFLGGLVADQVTVTATVGGVEVYSTTRSLSTREVLNYFDHYFKPFTSRESVLFRDLPLHTEAVFTVTITGSGLVGCSSLVIGQGVYLGRTQQGAEARAKNFSRIDRDQFGNAVLVPRRMVPTANMTIWFEKARTKPLLELRDRTNAVPVVWSGLDDDTSDYFEPVLIVGIHTTFDLNLAHPNDGLLSLTCEEV